MAFLTVPVAAGAYPHTDTRSRLTHAVDAETWLPLCDYVKAESLLDDAELATDAAPTCPYCRRALDRAKKRAEDAAQLLLGGLSLEEARAAMKDAGKGAGVPAWAKGGTATQRARAARGLHPMGMLLKGGDGGETCGGCTHLRRNSWSRVYLKCDLIPPTGGPGTDIRAKWPACDKWEAKKD